MRKFKSRLSPKDEKGFASIEFVFLMGFSILLLTGFLNVLFIEYHRNSVLTSLRDAARSGTRIVDLQKANPDQLLEARQECIDRGKESLNDLIDGGDLDVTCTVSISPSGVASMKAQLSTLPTNTVFVPWAAPYKAMRLTNLSETFVQRKAASNE